MKERTSYVFDYLPRTADVVKNIKRTDVFFFQEETTDLLKPISNANHVTNVSLRNTIFLSQKVVKLFYKRSQSLTASFKLLEANYDPSTSAKLGDQRVKVSRTSTTGIFNLLVPRKYGHETGDHPLWNKVKFIDRDPHVQGQKRYSHTSSYYKQHPQGWWT